MRPIILHYKDAHDNDQLLMIVCPFHVYTFKRTEDGETQTVAHLSTGASYRVNETMDEIQQLVLAALTEY